MRTIALLPIAALVLACGAGADSSTDGLSETIEARRIVDVHVHALRLGPRTLPPGTPDLSVGLEGLEFLAPASNEALRDSTIATLRRSNVVTSVLSGRQDVVGEWVGVAPELFLQGLLIGNPPVGHALAEVLPDAVESLHQAGRLDVLGEIASQYMGLPPTHETLTPYFALAEELDIPVHVHTAGVGAWVPTFRSAMGRPLLLEEVLARHPNLRIYLENAGYPFLDDMLALFFQYPDRVYADVSTVMRIVPRQEFYRYLKILVEAGFGDRIMFGSDQVVWPQTIEFEIRVIEEAPFLTDQQKDDIFYNNAVRFFRLEDAGP